MYNIALKCTSDTKLQSMQFKVNHNFLATKFMLCKMGLTDDNSCTYCKEITESTYHLLVDCMHVRSLWSELQGWLMRVAGCETFWTDTEILFGTNTDNCTLINHLMLITKQYIYGTTLHSQKLSFVALLNIIRNTFKVELLSARVNFRQGIFFRKWGVVYNYLND